MKANPFISNKYRAFIILIVMLYSLHNFAQKDIPADYCINSNEIELFNQLNRLIDEYGKMELELSASLSYVAHVHVNDLLINRPDTSVCNLSSWSGNGDWTACCHNPYVPQQDCMWDKPKELTTYPYRGYELVSYFEDDFTIDSVLKLWSTSKVVLDMILTEHPFSNAKRYNSNQVSRDKLVVVAHPELKGLKKGFPKSLKGVSYLGFSGITRFQQDVEFYFETENVQPELIGRVDDVTLMRIVTEQSACFSVMPYRAVVESIKAKRLALIGELGKGHNVGIWATYPVVSPSAPMVKRVLKSYFKRKS